MTSEWKLAPLAASLEMQNAGWREADRQGIDLESVEMQPIYQAMLAEAPQPPALGGEPIQRYTMGAHNKLIEAISGEWVRLEDHDAHVAPLLAELAQLKAEIAALRAAP